MKMNRYAFNSLWQGRCAPWLRAVMPPASRQIETPLRVARTARGPQAWAPYLAAVQMAYDPLFRSGINPRRG
jgi:hypothetical protein